MGNKIVPIKAFGLLFFCSQKHCKDTSFSQNDTIYRATFTMFVPRADENNAMVRHVKLWFPPSHFVTSLGRCPVIFANWLLVIPFCFITASILAAIPSVSSVVALSRGVIFASSSFSMSSYISIISHRLHYK